jgi:hypothetical protein
MIYIIKKLWKDRQTYTNTRTIINKTSSCIYFILLSFKILKIPADHLFLHIIYLNRKGQFDVTMRFQIVKAIEIGKVTHPSTKPCVTLFYALE